MTPSPTLSELRALVLLAAGAALTGCAPADGKSEVDETGLYNPDGGDGGDGTDGTDGGDGTDGTVPAHWESCDPDTPPLTRPMIESGWVEAALLCAELDAAGDCPAKEDFPATEVMYEQFDLEWGGVGWDAWPTCGPADHTPDQCCYVVQVSMWAEGRPFAVHGAARTARDGAEGGWCSAADLDCAPHAALADAWHRRALAEHASVASFSRFALQLLHLGAPADLVAGAHAAALDEVRHAQAAFGVARALGSTRGPGPLDTTGALDGALDLDAILEDLILHGCIGETLAAAEAAEEARRAAHPAIAEALSRIAHDEAAHAALAWRALRWLLAERPDAWARARSLLRDSRPAAAEERVPGVAEATANAHGLLTAAQRDALVAQVRRAVILPAAEALPEPPRARCA